jgi:GntR family transcriptional repressor for pyruvate dehydrogenase complex
MAPLAAPLSLTGALAERLAEQIRSGQLQPGQRLPTEQEMTAAMGVSRTVVREAVSALRAEGLVTTRQGVGAFVATEILPKPFRIDPQQLKTIREAVDVMELRTGVEIEAAGLAAERGSDRQLERVAKAMAAFERAVGRGESGVEEDFALHRAIAEATGNPQFHRFLDYLGRIIIPRQSVRYGAEEKSEERQAYLARLVREHRAIADAVVGRQLNEARAAMRRHMMNSRERYRKLAERIEA